MPIDHIRVHDRVVVGCDLCLHETILDSRNRLEAQTEAHIKEWSTVGYGYKAKWLCPKCVQKLKNW